MRPFSGEFMKSKILVTLALAGMLSAGCHNKTTSTNTDSGIVNNSDSGTTDAATTHDDAAVTHDMGTTIVDATVEMDSAVGMDASADAGPADLGPEDMGPAIDLGFDAGSSVSVDNWPLALATLVCDHPCGDSQLDLTGIPLNGTPACYAIWERYINFLVLAQIGPALDAGLTRFDSAAAATCFHAAAATCFDVAFANEPACNRWLAPGVATGGACNSDQQCQPTDTCIDGGVGMCGAPLGTCTTVPTATVGQSCAGNIKCYDPAYANVSCDTVGDASICRARVVSPTAAQLNDSCAQIPPTDGSFVTTTIYCAAGLYCDNNTLTCLPKTATGAACNNGNVPCATGANCEAAADVDAGMICQAPVFLELHAACQIDGGTPCSPLSALVCVPGVGDSTMGTCQPGGHGELGDVCPATTGYQVLSADQCHAGLYCDPTWHCATQAAIGAPCVSNMQCTSNLCAANDDGGMTCASPTCP